MSDFVEKNTVHVPVLLQEVLDLLNPNSKGVYVDGTLGGGGHTEAIVRKIQEIQNAQNVQEDPKINQLTNQLTNIVEKSGIVIAMDRDIAAINQTEKRLRKIFSHENEKSKNSFNKKFPIRFAHANYRHVDEVLDLLQINKIDGFLLDLGLSSDQLIDNDRGFSFDSTGLLDLRFDVTEGETAYELLERLRENEIADLIYQFGEERYSRRIAQAITKQRNARQPIRTARQLAELVRNQVPRKTKANSKKHSVNLDPATRTFQALRIAVNEELESLKSVLKIVPNRLKTNGVMAVISFHSLEDRIVKNAFRENPQWEVITKKPVMPSEEEIKRNPRARSAKLRAARKR